MAFIAAFVAQNTKFGVLITPCGVVTVPNRARLVSDCFTSSNEKFSYGTSSAVLTLRSSRFTGKVPRADDDTDGLVLKAVLTADVTRELLHPYAVAHEISIAHLNNVNIIALAQVAENFMQNMSMNSYFCDYINP
jgi:hypothetical protein